MAKLQTWSTSSTVFKPTTRIHGVNQTLTIECSLESKSSLEVQCREAFDVSYILRPGAMVEHVVFPSVEVWFRSLSGEAVEVILHPLSEPKERLSLEAWATIEGKMRTARQLRLDLEEQLHGLG